MFEWLARLGNTIKYTARWVWNGVTLLPSLWRLFKLRPPRVTFFGGGRLALTDRYAQDAHTLANQCVHYGMTIITGGGGGIMQAAALGAEKTKQEIEHTIGITITGLPEYQLWPAYDYLVRVDNLVVRKWLMLNFSAACVIFPGGVGTYNEFAEVLTLIDMNLLPSIPIILYGKEFWEPFLTWMANDGVQRGFVKATILESFTLVNTPQEALNQLETICNHNCHSSTK